MGWSAGSCPGRPGTDQRGSFDLVTSVGIHAQQQHTRRNGRGPGTLMAARFPTQMECVGQTEMRGLEARVHSL